MVGDCHDLSSSSSVWGQVIAVIVDAQTYPSCLSSVWRYACFDHVDHACSTLDTDFVVKATADVFPVSAWCVLLGHVCQTVENFSCVTSRSAFLAPYCRAKQESFSFYFSIAEVPLFIGFAQRVFENRVEWVLLACEVIPTSMATRWLSIAAPVVMPPGRSLSSPVDTPSFVVDGSMVVATWSSVLAMA